MDFLSYLLSTDIKILVGIIIIALITLAALAYTEADQEPESITVYDWYYKDDHGNTFVVTSAAIEDNWDLLIRDHGLSAAYISRHVFLAGVEKVF